jgi:hypothetical protein
VNRQMRRKIGKGRGGRTAGRRLLVVPSALALGAGTQVLLGAASSPPAGAVGGCVCQSVNVPLATHNIIADNISSYPNSRITLLVQLADRGLVTQDPLGNNVAGLMNGSDRVIVTEYGMYWIDVANRSGLLGGMWPLEPNDGSGNANFAHVVNSHNWAPNDLLPGSRGTPGPDNTVAGLGVRVLAAGAADDPHAPAGRGTFVIQGAADNFTSLVQGYDHLYQFSGIMHQQGDNNTTVMADNTGPSNDLAQMQFVLTYRFRDANDPNTTNGISDQYINRTEVSLTPSVNSSGSCVFSGTHCINLSVFDVGTDLQYLDSGQSSINLMKDFENTLGVYSNYPGCFQGNVNKNTWAGLCPTPNAPNGVNFIEEPTTLPTTLQAGDFADFCTSNCTEDISYKHPSFPMMPARDSSVWNPALDVIATETQYFNTSAGDPVQTWKNGSTAQTALDMTLQYFA